MKSLLWTPFITVCIAWGVATAHSIYVYWTTPYPPYIACFEPESDDGLFLITEKTEPPEITSKGDENKVSLLALEPACMVTLEVFVVSDGYAMGWDCLPDSLKDGEMRIDWVDMTYFQRRGKLVVFAYYLDGPFDGRAYRLREDDLGSHIVRDGKKVYLHIKEEEL